MIRTAVPEDAVKLLEIYAPYVEKTAVSFEYSVPSEEEFRSRICKTLERYPWLVAFQGTEPAGYAYAGAFKGREAYDWAVESSIYVKMDKKRFGIGRRLYGALEAALKDQGILNVNACIACPKEEDEYLTKDSIFFHEKQGYRMAGRFFECGYKFDRWYDMVWMEKHIGDHKTPQPPVIWFSELEKKGCRDKEDEI
ncbi:MAG: GNAT family N-acetyltransferase [Eubacteriales bacterium]|nr:GNAT family N-acetyltransferase [Eubacteriales bacterium]